MLTGTLLSAHLLSPTANHTTHLCIACFLLDCVFDDYISECLLDFVPRLVAKSGSARIMRASSTDFWWTQQEIESSAAAKMVICEYSVRLLVCVRLCVLDDLCLHTRACTRTVWCTTTGFTAIVQQAHFDANILKRNAYLPTVPQGNQYLVAIYIECVIHDCRLPSVFNGSRFS